MIRKTILIAGTVSFVGAILTSQAASTANRALSSWFPAAKAAAPR